MKPLKAPTDSITDEQLSILTYPVLGSIKLDGFRCVIDGTAKTSSLKPITNTYTREMLSRPELYGLDGELVVGEPNAVNVFNRSSSELRRVHGKPDFVFYVFDRFSVGKGDLDTAKLSYENRWINVLSNFYNFYDSYNVYVLPQTVLHSPQDVIQFTKGCVDAGFEGAMIRSYEGRYKYGRATFNERIIYKRKPLTDDEAVIVGFKAKRVNLNEQKINALGYSERSSCKAGMVEVDTLGSFILQSPKWEKPFSCRGKISDSLAKEIWENKNKYLGKIVTYRYQQYGSIDAPRQPTFRRFYKEI